MAEPHYVIITPQNIGVGFAPDDDGEQRVLLTMEYDSKDAPWLAPDIRLAIGATPEEARTMADSLRRMADAAEAEQTRSAR